MRRHTKLNKIHKEKKIRNTDLDIRYEDSGDFIEDFVKHLDAKSKEFKNVDLMRIKFYKINEEEE